jgi:hypothetical protein
LDCSVGIVMGYVLDYRSSIHGMMKWILSGPEAYPACYAIVIERSLPWGRQSKRDADRTNLPRWRMVELHLHSTIRLHANWDKAVFYSAHFSV